jgi:hypothetical protein
VEGRFSNDTRLRVAFLVLTVLGCAGTVEPSREQLAAESNALVEALAAEAPPAEGTLRVRLAFGADADLDLYVTGPSQETVYFANASSREGGRLDGDRLCADPAPRIETVTFPEFAPGRYRVGVDYPKTCADRGTAAFVIYVEVGTRREERRGSIRLGEVVPIVLETDAP